ncbi:DNA binding [Microdochium nivale]|nr:DNA binding [Microdochium nivale]
MGLSPISDRLPALPCPNTRHRPCPASRICRPRAASTAASQEHASRADEEKESVTENRRAGGVPGMSTTASTRQNGAGHAQALRGLCGSRNRFQYSGTMSASWRWLRARGAAQRRSLDLLLDKDAAEEDGGEETTAAIHGGTPMMAKARGTAGEGARARDSKSSEAPIDDVCSVMWKVSIDDDGTCSVVGPSGNFCGPTAEVRGSPPLPATPELVDDEGYEDSGDAPAHELLKHFAGHINAVHHYVDDELLVTLEPALQPTASRSLLRCAVLAAAALFADRPRAARERQSLVYAQAAAAAAAECCRTHPCAMTVSALVIMTWRELGLDNTMAASLYNAMGSSVCVHLGLHTSSLENLRRLHVGPLGDDQERGNRHDPVHVNNRAFWAAFNTDRCVVTVLVADSRLVCLPIARLGLSVPASSCSHAALYVPGDEVGQTRRGA